MTILDTNVLGATAEETTLSSETRITLYVCCESGSHGNHHVGVEASPDGVKWMRLSHSLRGEGVQNYEVCASKVRVVVTEAEGSASTVDVYIVAR